MIFFQALCTKYHANFSVFNFQQFLKKMDIEAGIDLLKKDKNMQDLIKKFGKPDFKVGQDYFQSLLRSIVFQQLSGKAAQTIYERILVKIKKQLQCFLILYF